MRLDNDIIKLSQTKRIILYGLSLLLMLQCFEAAPQNFDFISERQLESTYVQDVMRNSKAAEMASFMNESVDPCQNFYKFACGNWSRINPANSPKDPSTGLLENLTKGLNRKIRKLLKAEDNDEDTAEDVQVKKFYTSCTRVHEIDESYQKKLKELISEFGSMPALEGDKWLARDFDWVDTIARIAYQYGLTIIVGAEVEKDVTNNEVNVVYISQQDFTLESRGMYLDSHTEHYRTVYQESIIRKLKTFLGLSSDLAQTTAREIVEFEVELAKGLINEGDGTDIIDLINQTTVAEMQRIYAPTFNVERLVTVSLGEQIKGTVNDYSPEFQQNLIKVIKRTPKSTLANYIFYQLVETFFIELGKTTAMREKQCIDLTKSKYAKNLDNMIYRHYNNNATAADIDLIWNELKSTFRKTLQFDQSLSWISRETRDLAIEKLDAMTLVVNSHVDEDLSEDFEGLQLQSEDYVENLRQTLIIEARKGREQLHEPVTPIDFGDLSSFTPANVLVENVIKVPVSVLQPYYLWAASYPNAIKFGTLAALIGHELIHGFDDSGRKFDKHGNVNEWWDEESTENFLQRQRCFSDQYSHYSYNGKRLPRMIAQSENIADNGGMRLAYVAYRNWQNAQELSTEGRKQLLKEKLPRLDYTNMQLFFISYAQIWCNDVHPRLRDLQVSIDRHVPGQFRVIGPLSNFQEFSKEFQCAVGTRMNPVKKCIIY